MKKNLRILLINDYFQLVGGTERYVISLYHELSLKNDVYIFSFGNKNTTKNNIKILKISNNKIQKYFRDGIFSPKIYFLLKKYIKHIKPDIIHVFNNNVATLSVLFAINNSNVPIVRTVCDYGFICPTAMTIKPNGINCYENFGINCVRNKCVSFRWYIMHVFEKKTRSHMNRKVFNMYLPFNFNLKKTLEKNETQSIIYLPLYTEIKKNNRREIKTNTEKNAILYVGALQKYKGLQYLLKSLAIVKTKIPDVKLYIIGTGDDEKLFRFICKKLNIENNVFFMGKVTDNELISFYKKTEMLVVPSIWQEMFGLVGIEALSYGKPVIGSNIGGIPEWLENGKNGFLVEPKNHVEMAKKIIALLENKNLSREMGEYGKKTLEKKFSKQKHIEKLELIYTNLVKNNDKK